MLALRNVHEQGPTRVSVDGVHILTGGKDGAVALFPLRRWPQAQPLWARQCHTAAVTCVALHDALHIAFSCGRDGHIFLHEAIHDGAAQSTSRTICRVTGEVRCMHFDEQAKRLFLGGDSLRCLRMAGGRFEVETVPLVVPSPITAVALAPCGTRLAMASTTGSVGVVSVSATGTTTGTGTGTEKVKESDAVRVVAEKVLSPSVGRDDQCAYRLQWCRTAGGLFLFLPSATEVSVLQLEASADANTTTTRLRKVGSLHGDGLSDYVSVSAYAVSAHRVCCVLATRSGLYVGKVDGKNFMMSRHASQGYGQAGEQETITDVQVNALTGDVAVALASGRVSVLSRLALKALDEAKEAEKKAKREEKKAQQVTTASVKLIGADTQDLEENEEEEEKERSKTVRRAEKQKSGKLRKSETNDDDDFVNDDASSASGSASFSSADSSPSSGSNTASESDSDLDDEGNVTVKENLERVVVDLKANNADFIDADDVERPSRWREDDPRRALAVAEREVRRRKEASSRFLDDEAEEASEGDAESEDAAAYEGDGYGRRRRGRRRDEEDNEDEEEDDEFGNGSQMAHVDGLVNGSAAGLFLSNNNNDINSGGVPQMLDYSFQVGATPAGEEESCYLAYNSTGYIRCTREGTTVHFHDVSNPAVRINEKGTIVMGTLSPAGAGFIVAPQQADELADNVDDDLPRLTVYFRTFIALGAQSDWRARLQPGETVRCMTAGTRFLAVATSRYLRLYSLSGLELAVLSKFPHIVAMAGTSSRKLMGSFKASFDPLAVVFLAGGEHKLEVLDVGTRSTAVAAQVLPLTELSNGASHQLQWLGWSEDGPLHVADTAGVVRMLTQSWGGAWVPVFDPRTLSDQSYNLWLWGVTDECLLAYRSTKTDPPYPAAVAMGLPVERAPLFLPLTRTATSTSDRETATWDHLLRREIRADELKRQSAFYSESIAKYDAVHDAKIKELFTAALRAQQTSRAMDLATMLELRDNLEDCAREANAGGHTQLVLKLAALNELRFKTKLKRKCTLPLEKTMVSDKERDEMLRRMLLREQHSTSGGAVRVETAKAATTTMAAGATSNTTNPREEESRTSGGGRVESSPAKSEASTTITATTDRSPQPHRAHASVGTSVTTVGKVSPSSASSTTTTAAAASAAHRRVTFNMPGEPTTSPATKTGPASSASSVVSSVVPAPVKPTNPFAAKKANAATATAPSAPALAAAMSREKMQTTLVSRQPQTRTTFSMPAAQTPEPSPVAPPPPPTEPLAMAELIGVDSQPTEKAHTQPPMPTADNEEETAVTTPPRPTTARTVTVLDDSMLDSAEETKATTSTHKNEEEVSAAAAAASGNDIREHHAASLSPSGGRTSGTTPITAEKRHNTFIPRVLATREADTTNTTTNTTAATANLFSTHSQPRGGSTGPVDPFLTENMNVDSPSSEEFYGGGGGGAISVEALLDAGHDEDSQTTAPRSVGFGEALRKRYRADDEDDSDGDGVVVPPTSFARA